ncbi:MAG: diguanylate cyclase [Actinomycetota bacterium]
MMLDWGFLLLVLFLGLAAGYVLARLVGRPLERTLRRYAEEARESRDELRRSLERLGETLRSTLDLDGILGVVLETAAVTLGAKWAAVYMLTPSGRTLGLDVARGFEPPVDARIEVGEGIAGLAATGRPVLVPSEEPPPKRSPVEPGATTAIAAPLVRGGRTIGVLALYGRPVPEPFHQEDVSVLGSFAAQASVAIENVLLHQETKRLSLTDGLTGVANRRSFQLTLGKEIERAVRFGHPLSLLMIDIDRFKRVNDEFGHQQGDRVLMEVCRRVLGSVRAQIDTFARYGGEEFTLLLPETPAEGARVVGEKIAAVVRDRPFETETETETETGARLDRPLWLTVSAGVASYPEDGRTAEELIGAADVALYRAKEAGRDRVEPPN